MYVYIPYMDPMGTKDLLQIRWWHFFSKVVYDSSCVPLSVRFFFWGGRNVFFPQKKVEWTPSPEVNQLQWAPIHVLVGNQITYKSSGWWLNQPIWKIFVKIGIFPKVRGENKKYLKPPPSPSLSTMASWVWGVCPKSTPNGYQPLLRPLNP